MSLLYKAKVAVTYLELTLEAYNSFIRIAYVKNIDQLKEAVKRIKSFL